MNYVVGISLFLGVCLVMSALYPSLLIAGLRARRAATTVRTLSWLTAALLLFTVLSIAAAASLNAMGPATYMIMWYAVLCSLGGFGIGGVLFILLSITTLVEIASRRRRGQAAVALTFSVFPFGVVALCVAAPGDQNVKLVVGFLLALLSLLPLLVYGAFFWPGDEKRVRGILATG